MTTDDQSNIIRASTSSYAMGSDDAELEANWRLICAARNDGDDNNENDGGISSNSEIIWREWFFSKMEKIVDMNSTTATTATTTTDSTNNNNLTAAAAANNNNNNPTLKNVTVVFGQAGSGKTFLMQLLCSSARFEDRILLPFFCKAAAAAAAGTPTDFLGDLEAAIGATFPALRQQIASSANASAKVANFNVHFREHTLRLLAAMGREEPAHQFTTSRRYLLLIDSIDLRPDICELISSNLHAFPPWLHVVITARQKRYRGITKMFSGARKIVLDDTKKGNVYGDLMGYLVANKDRMVGDKAAEKAEDQSAPTSISNAVFSKMIAKSNGAVLYLRLLRDGLQRGVLSLSQLDFIGGTLNGLYLALFTALFNGGGGEGSSAEREADYKTVLSLLDRGNAFQVTVDEVRRKLGLGEETEGGDDAYLAELLDQLLLHGLVVFTSSSEQAAATAIRLVHGSLFERREALLGEVRLPRPGPAG